MNRGPIEANSLHLIHQRVVIFPRSMNRGPIEALEKFFAESVCH